MAHRRVARTLALLNVLVFFVASPALAQFLSKDQQSCIIGMNKAGAKVAATQGKENSSCVGAATGGKLVGQDADQCIVADNKGKMTKATQKTVDAQAKCSALPSYGFSGSATTNSAAVDAELDIVHAVFGSTVATAILTDKAGGGCQTSVTKAYEKFAAARGKAFVACKSGGYKLGSITGPAGLVNCIDDDAKGKVGGARTKLKDTVDTKCVGVSLPTAFPGCSAEAGSSLALSDCIARKSECQMCLMFEAMDAIDAPCDLLDDGSVNQTCRQCLNGATEAPEQCDDGAESALCDDDCTFAACPDGHVNSLAGEQCDDGNVSNNDTCPGTCETATCGDGFLCNAGGCTTGPTGGAEQCDTGGANSNVTPDACRTNCKNPGCGDNVTDTGEQCDDGGVNSATCDSNCTIAACHDGFLNTAAGEQCDDGNVSNNDACPGSCVTATCGDGFLCNAGGCTTGPTGGAEQCDNGGANSNVTPDACRTNCKLPTCGDNVVDTGEACDSGGVNTPTCDSNCTLAACHDGFLNTAAGEQCDDGNLSNNDACVGSCVTATCGDGFLCNAVGCTTGPSGGLEQCDNDGANSNVTPDACRTNCKLASCGDNVTDTGEFCDTGGNSATCDANCTAAACGDGFTNPNTVPPEQCDGGGETASCDPDCTNRVCGDSYKNVTAAEECDDGNTTSGDLCSSTCKCGPGSGELGCQDPQCPSKGQLTLLAGITTTACTTNGDCIAGTCDTGLGVCTTQSELDTGWTGIAHDADVNHNVRVMGRLLCEGPASPTCGQCQVVGLLPDFQNCRCANNNRTVCDKPFVADSANCGATNNTCNCYFGAPLPLSSGNVPACAVNRFAQNVSGTANVDTGAGLINASLKSIVFATLSKVQPCAGCGGTCTAPAGKVGLGCGTDLDCDTSQGSADGVCGNYDPIIGDGVRGGTCFGGLNDGMSCDIMAPNSSFPAPGGPGGFSLDCFPDTGQNVSGTGLSINLQQTTGTSALPAAALTCGYGFKVCPCGECSGDTLVACRSNADCTGIGTCSAVSSEYPNQCDDGVCTPLSSEEGECLANLPDKTCDGVVRANGEGIIGCFNDADCGTVGIDAGNCTLAKQRKCFLDPITAAGIQDAAKPLAVATFCAAKTSSAGINNVAGLPGPGRVKNQGVSTLFCASNPSFTYTPGVGGCP